MASSSTDTSGANIIVAKKAGLDTLNSSFTPPSSNDAMPHRSTSSNSSNIIDSLMNTGSHTHQYHFLLDRTSPDFPQDSRDSYINVDRDSNNADRHNLTEEQKRYFDPVDKIIGTSENETHIKVTPLHDFEEFELEDSSGLNNHSCTDAVYITPFDEFDESAGRSSTTAERVDSAHWQHYDTKHYDTKHFSNQQADYHPTYIPEYASHYHSADSTAPLHHTGSVDPFVSRHEEPSERLYTDNADPESSGLHHNRFGDPTAAVLWDYDDSHTRYHLFGSLSGPHHLNGSTEYAGPETLSYYPQANGMPRADYHDTDHAGFEGKRSGEPISAMLTDCFSTNTGASTHGSNPSNALTHRGNGQFRCQSSQWSPLDNAFDHGEVKEEPLSYSHYPITASPPRIGMVSTRSDGDTILQGTRLDRMQSFRGFHKDIDAAYNYMSQVRRKYDVTGQDDWQRVEADPIPFVSGIYEAMSTLKPEADSSQISYWSTMTRKGHEQEMIEARAWDIVQTAITQHKHGIANFLELEIHKRDPLDNSMCCSERLERIQEILYGDKLVCKDVVDGNKVTYLVATPNAWINRKNDNRRLNKDKGLIMRAGKRTVSQYQNAQVNREVDTRVDYLMNGVESGADIRDLAHRSALPSEVMELQVEGRAKSRPKSRRPPKRAKKNDDDEEWAPRRGKGKKRESGGEDE
ncbi:MAG: hypothetical protein Q9165_006179 [Trypethelium subeluteriae]